MEERYKEQTLKSSEYYANVVNVSFVPEFELPELKKVVSKGDPIYERRGLFRRRMVEIGKEDNDRYDFHDPKHYYWGYWKTLEELADIGQHRIAKKGKIYRQSKVTVATKSGTDTNWFNTNEDAMKFMEDVKSKCSSCGNKLL